MDKFMKELGEHTKEIHEIGHGVYDNKDLAKKIKNDLKGLSKDEIAKKIKKSSENMPDKVQVQNLTRAQAQVQSVDKDDIE